MCNECKCTVHSDTRLFTSERQQRPFYSPLIQDNPGEPVLSQRRDLLKQPLDFNEPDALPAAQTTLQENLVVWSYFVLQTWYQHPCLTNSVKVRTKFANRYTLLTCMNFVPRVENVCKHVAGLSDMLDSVSMVVGYLAAFLWQF